MNKNIKVFLVKKTHKHIKEPHASKASCIFFASFKTMQIKLCPCLSDRIKNPNKETVVHIKEFSSYPRWAPY